LLDVPSLTTERLLLRGFEVAYTLGRAAWGHGSIRVATSLGATAAETVEFFGAPAVLYRYPRSAT